MVNKIKSYYDDFFRSRMLSYRVDGNLRLDLAFNTIKEHLKPGMKVADIGCGIGIISENIAKSDKSIEVLGLDISRKNIEYAKLTVSLPNAHFFEFDFTEDEDETDTEASSTHDRFKDFDLLVLVDAIEHFPEDQRIDVFKRLSAIANEDARLILTYPSEEYQSHLHHHDPNELQVVDNSIPAMRLLSEAGDAGWRLVSYRYEDVWRTNQYVHVVFSKANSLNCISHQRSLSVSSVIKQIKMTILRPLNRHRYLKVPLKKMSGNE